MKNVVTFETAVRLKEAGFLQPNFATGQFWYNDLGALTFVGRKELSETDEHHYFYCTSVESGRTDFFQPIADDAFFAPTAIEILQELEYADLTFRDGKFRVVSEHVMNRHDNPAEASALAWLELHEKKNLQK